MPYYKVCPHCGSNLDPGEQCECAKEKHSETYSKKKGGEVYVGNATDASGKVSWKQDRAVRVG